MAIKDHFRDRQFVIRGIFILAIALLLVKAMQLQLIDSTYQDRARTTAIEKVVDYPSRGLIFDRSGKLVVNNNAIYDLMCTYNRVDAQMDTTYFCELLGITKAYFDQNINKNFRSVRYSKSVPFLFMSKISGETYARFQEAMYEFPGFEIQLRNVRGYPYRNSAHVLGYMSEVNPQQVSTSGGVYKNGDFIGSSGIELTYENDLRGEKGIRYVLKDNLGRPVGAYREGEQDTTASSGNDLISSLDIDLQTLGERLMKNKSGSIVAIEPATGEILSLISSPSYDPNLLTINRIRGEAFTQLQRDTLNKPFFNRGIMAKYPPGSIFKTVVSLVAMQEDLIQPSTGMTCNGAYYYGGSSWGCHAHTRPNNLAVALEHSCNTYYFTTLRKIIDQYGFYEPHKGLENFNQYLTRFGLGQPLGIDIPDEGAGNIPTPAYYDRLYPRVEGSWKSPTIMSIGIGQGEIEMTTVQMANLSAIIANKGWYYTPHLIKAHGDRKEIPDRFRVRKEVNIDEQYFEPVIEGMERAVKSGTGNIAFVPGLSICGKTGTSQNPHGKDHSVFFAFAPRDNPKIAVAVYVEHGVWGARYAAPISSLIIEQYLTGTIRDSRMPLLERMEGQNLLALAD
ncbi:MAG: penicillin-binding protein 2 [Saprospiraceae bacterium]|nr:penicillin-binding protein 2 [Saprospiraceae bacterium]